jgi:hypothetical protein
VQYEKDVEGSDHGLSEGTSIEKDLRIDCTPKEIRTVILPNTSRKHYRFSQLILHLKSVSRIYGALPSCLFYTCRFGCLFAGSTSFFFFCKVEEQSVGFCEHDNEPSGWAP